MSDKKIIPVNSENKVRALSPRRSASPKSPKPQNSPNSKKQTNININQFDLYFKIATKVLILLFTIFMIIFVFKSISDDVLSEVEMQNEKERDLLKNYQKEYEEKQCKEKKYIQLKERCDELEILIHKTPYKVPKSKVAVKYFAILLNELFNPLSPKTVILVSLIVVLIIWLPKAF